MFNLIEEFLEILNPNFCEGYDYPTDNRITYREYVNLNPKRICYCTLCNFTFDSMCYFNPLVDKNKLDELKEIEELQELDDYFS